VEISEDIVTIELLLALVFVFLGVLGVLVASKRFTLMNIAPYVFPTSYVRGLEAKLLKSRQIQELMESKSSEDLFAILSRTDYGEYLEGGGGYSHVERAVDQRFAEICHSISETLPWDKRRPLDAYLRKWDISNIKAVVRGVRNRLEPTEILQMVVPAGSLNPVLLQRAAETEDLALLPSIFRGTEFEPLLEKLSLEYAEKGFVAFDLGLNLLLCRAMENGFKGVPSLERKGMPPLQRYLAVWKDLNNIQTAIRAKIGGLSVEDLAGLLIDGGDAIYGPRIKSLAEAEGVDGVLSVIALTPYSEAIDKAMRECAETESLVPLDVTINKLLLAQAREMLKEPFGMGAILGYIIALEYEIATIKGVARAKEEGWVLEQIATRTVAG
jgi:V/A-type H+-transporting ATPase subunit C